MRRQLKDTKKRNKEREVKGRKVKGIQKVKSIEESWEEIKQIVYGAMIKRKKKEQD